MKLFPTYDDNIGNSNHKEEIVMKKFALGIIVGALLFGAMPAFADTVSNLLGKKVEGVYTVQTEDGKKIADAAVINGSTYAPVRAVAEATGTTLTVEGKVITLSESVIKTTNVDALKDELEMAKLRLTSAQSQLTKAQEKLDRFDENYEKYKTRLDAALESGNPDSISIAQKALTEIGEISTREKAIEEAEAAITKAQAEIAEFEAKIAELEE